MSVNIIKTPPDVALAGNEILFRTEGTNHYSVNGVKAIGLMRFAIDESFYDEDSFLLEFHTYSFIYIFKTSPTSFLHLQEGVADEDIFIANIIARLNLNPYIFTNYILDSFIDQDSYVIRFSARTADSIYNISVDHALSYLDFTMQTSGIKATVNPFHRINTIIEIDATIYQDSQPADNLSISDFKIQEYLKPHLFSEFLFPETASSTLMIDRPDICKAYSTRFYESYGNPPLPYPMTSGVVKYALSGGISIELEAKYNEEDTTFWEELAVSKKFLTNSSVEKITRYGITEKLWFLNYTDYTSVRVVISVFFTDDTAESIYKSLKTVTKYKVYEIIVSPDILDFITTYPTKTVKLYTVTIETDESVAISDTQVFYIDETHHENIRKFMFSNSFKVFETIWTAGEVQKEIAIETSEFSKVLPTGYTQIDSEIIQNRGIENQTFKAVKRCNTKAEVEYMREFLISDIVYEIISNKLYPIILTSTKVFLMKDNETNYAVEFEYKRAYTDTFYSVIS